MNNKTLQLFSLLLTVIMLLSALPFMPVSAKFDSEKTDYVFLGADELNIASDCKGERLTDDNGTAILRFSAAKTSRSGAAVFYPNKTSVGFSETGDGSFYDYAYYVFRYRTSGNARTSDTINLRGMDHTGVSREKYGGSDQITKSDEYVIKTVARDTFLYGGGVEEAPNKNWTEPWITLKIFETSNEAGYLDLDFIACFKTEKDAKNFISAYNDGSFVRSDASKPSSGGTFVKQNKTIEFTMYTDNAKSEMLNVSLGSKIAEMLASEASEYGAQYIDAQIPATDTVKTVNITLVKDTLASLCKSDRLTLSFLAKTVKVTLGSAILSELSALESDIVISLTFDGDAVSITLTSGNKEITTENSARILLNVHTSDSFAVTTVNGKSIPLSGIITTKPTVSTKLPATVSFETGKHSAFTDTDSHWAQDYISFVSARALFNGVTETEFAPNDTMTRAMAATVLMRLADENIDGDFTYTYTDVNNDAWFAPSVEWVYQTKIADTAAVIFRPDDPITREELAGFIKGFADCMGINTKTEHAVTFKDSASISKAYTDAISYCSANKIINGYDDGTFLPQNNATRAEVSTMITRFVNQALKANEIDITEYQDIPFDEDNIVLSFVALSDIHIDSADAISGAAVNYKNAIDLAYELSATGGLDLAFVLGDMTQNTAYDNVGTNEISYFKKHTDSFLNDDTALVFCTGNHDVSSSKNYEEDFTKIFTSTDADVDRYYKYDVDMDAVNSYSGNRHAVINGYHFITIGMKSDIISYAKPILEEITAKEPNKPVFVGYHYHATDTVYATRYEDSPVAAMKTLLDEFPQAVYFSGHSHNGLENPRAIWQGNFTAIDTASVRYLDDNSLINYSIKIPVNATHSEVFKIASEGTLVEVDKNNNIRFTAYNGYRGDIVATYTIAGPKDDGTHLLTYTDGRMAYSEPPVFDDDAKFMVQSNTGGNATVIFDQAKQKDITWYYIIEFTAEGKTPIKKYVTSRYFDEKGMPDRLIFSMGGFSSGTTYTVTLTPYDVWDQPGESITTEFKA